jgi:protein-tyrosine phosphatase
VIDIHTHLLPDLDDGSRSLSESLETIRMLSAQGYDTVLCTPHISITYPNSEYGIKNKYNELKTAILESSINMTLYYGAEYLLETLYEIIITDQPVIYINPENEFIKYILVELPYLIKPVWMDKLLNHLSNNNIGIIVAHPERCNRIDIIKEIDKSCECIFAINASSVLGNDGGHIKNEAFGIISYYPEKIVFASDSHPALHRYPQFDKLFALLNKIYSPIVIEYWFTKIPHMIMYEKMISNSEKDIISLYTVKNKDYKLS